MQKITTWNHPRIRRLNPGVALPALEITPVHRSDSSGTTFNFTDYLSRVSGSWRERLGKGTVVNWSGGFEANGSPGGAAGLTGRNGGLRYGDVAVSLKRH